MSRFAPTFRSARPRARDASRAPRALLRPRTHARNTAPQAPAAEAAAPFGARTLDGFAAAPGLFASGGHYACLP